MDKKEVRSFFKRFCDVFNYCNLFWFHAKTLYLQGTWGKWSFSILHCFNRNILYCIVNTVRYLGKWWIVQNWKHMRLGMNVKFYIDSHRQFARLKGISSTDYCSEKLSLFFFICHDKLSCWVIIDNSIVGKDLYFVLATLKNPYLCSTRGEHGI